MISKAVIFNLALEALLLTKQVINPDQDQSEEAAALRTQWDVAFRSALFDLDLDSTAVQAQLQLVVNFRDQPEQPGEHAKLWHFGYGYPSNCAFFRRVVSKNVIDDKFTHHRKRVMLWQQPGGPVRKLIFCDAHFAWGEYIPTDFPIQTLTAPAAQSIAHRLAWQSAPLIVGKGSKELRDQIAKNYGIYKAEAQALDERESFSFQTEENMSEFVKVRLS